MTIVSFVCTKFPEMKERWRWQFCFFPCFLQPSDVQHITMLLFTKHQMVNTIQNFVFNEPRSGSRKTGLESPVPQSPRAEGNMCTLKRQQSKTRTLWQRRSGTSIVFLPSPEHRAKQSRRLRICSAASPSWGSLMKMRHLINILCLFNWKGDHTSHSDSEKQCKYFSFSHIASHSNSYIYSCYIRVFHSLKIWANGHSHWRHRTQLSDSHRKIGQWNFNMRSGRGQFGKRTDWISKMKLKRKKRSRSWLKCNYLFFSTRAPTLVHLMQLMSSRWGGPKKLAPEWPACSMKRQDLSAVGAESSNPSSSRHSTYS